MSLPQKKKSDNILIITNGNFPFGGASANFLRLLSVGLSERGLKTKVILPSGYLYGNERGKIKVRKGTYKNVEYQYLGFKNHPLTFFLKIISSLIGLTRTFFYLIIGAIKPDFNIIIRYNSSITDSLICLF